MSLIHPEVILGLARVMTIGAKIYGDKNYMVNGGLGYGRYYSALQRHMLQWWIGEDKDPTTGLSHLDHAMACLAILKEYEATGEGIDDR